MTIRIHKQTVPVDGQWHDVPGPIVRVAVGDYPTRVRVWFEDDDEDPYEARRVCVFGTGQPLPPERTTHVGTVVDDTNRLVWHVRELARPDFERPQS